MFVDNELLAVVYLILYLRKGEKQNVLISKLKGFGSKAAEDIDACSDECFTYDLIDESIFALTSKVIQPIQIDQLLEKVQYVKKQDAFTVIANMSNEKRIKIAKCLEGSYVSEEEESYFQECCMALKIQMEIQDGEVILTKKKVFCVKCGTGTYYFASRNDAEEGIKILSGNDMRPAVQNHFLISEQMQPIDCHIWTLAALDAQQRELDREWYSQPAFIANDVNAWLEKKVQAKEASKHRGAGTSSSRTRPPQQTGCIVPLVVCMTGLVLSCVVVAVGISIALN